MLWIAPAEFFTDFGVGVLPEACEIPCFLNRAEVRRENVVTHFELAVCDFVLAAELHKVFDACRYLDENAVCTLYNLAAALFIGGGDFLIAVTGSLAVGQYVMIGECFLQPCEHGLAEVIFDNVAVTVFVDVAQKEYAVRKLV